MSSSVAPEIVVGHWFDTDTPMQPSNTTELPRDRGAIAGNHSWDGDGVPRQLLKG